MHVMFSPLIWTKEYSLYTHIKFAPIWFFVSTNVN